jgi:hypothetical protein
VLLTSLLKIVTLPFVILTGEKWAETAVYFSELINDISDTKTRYIVSVYFFNFVTHSGHPLTNR